MSNFILRSGNCSGFLDNEGCNGTILPMLTRFLQGFRRFDYEFQIITPGRKIPELFSRQSLEDSFIVELPPGSRSTLIGIALCAVFEDQENSAALPEFDSFIIECFLGVPSHPYTYSHKIGHLVSDHLWVLFVPIKQGCGSQIKILFKTCYGKDGGRARETCSSVKKCEFRLVFELDVEKLKEKHGEPIHPHCPLGNSTIQKMHKLMDNGMRQVQVEVEALTKIFIFISKRFCPSTSKTKWKFMLALTKDLASSQRVVPDDSAGYA